MFWIWVWFSWMCWWWTRNKKKPWKKEDLCCVNSCKSARTVPMEAQNIQWSDFICPDGKFSKDGLSMLSCEYAECNPLSKRCLKKIDAMAAGAAKALQHIWYAFTHFVLEELYDMYIYICISQQVFRCTNMTCLQAPGTSSQRSRPEMVWEASKIESSKAGENWESLYFPIALIMNNQLIQPQCIMYIQFAFDPCVLAKIKINELNTSKTFPWQGARSFSSTHKFRYLHTCAYIFRDLHTFALAFKPACFFSNQCRWCKFDGTWKSDHQIFVRPCFF